MALFRLSSIPALEGDCLVLSYGSDETHARHVVIDGGHTGTAPRLISYLEEIGAKEIELLVITHVDADHIEGILTFVESIKGKVAIRDVWFNGYRHLAEHVEELGYMQGEKLTEMLKALPWNKASGGNAIRVNEDGSPRVMPELEGGLKLTVLSPDAKKLLALQGDWKKTCEAAGLVPGVDRAEAKVPEGYESLGAYDLEALAKQVRPEDKAKPNGSSIALLAEFAAKSVVLGADAHPDILTQSLKTLGNGERLKIDLFKVPHHGSDANVTKDLLAAVDCDTFLFSTNGNKFRHPDEVAVARTIQSSERLVKLLFNYRQKHTTIWAERADDVNFTCHFADDGAALEHHI
jgi:beta-lactamase superfamily II metal-dependent hydrolase